MNIRGFIETSFLDWDGKVTSVVFLPYCNFKCPFCNNVPLLENPEELPEVKVETIEDFVRPRQGFIDGIVITGGEPTIHPWLPELIKRFKALGTLVKLDTNGSNPELLKGLVADRLLDYIAMDLKAPLNHKYRRAAGHEVDLDIIRESINLIRQGPVAYEFRVTVVPTIHEEADAEELARAVKGAQKFVLQQFVPDHTLDEKLRIIAPYPKEALLRMAEAARRHVPNTIVRGV